MQSFVDSFFFHTIFKVLSFWSKYQSALPPSLPSSLAPPLPFKTAFFIGLEFMCHVINLFNVYSSMVHKLCDHHHNQLKTLSLFQKETPAIHFPPTPTSPTTNVLSVSMASQFCFSGCDKIPWQDNNLGEKDLCQLRIPAHSPSLQGRQSRKVKQLIVSHP